MTAAHEQEPVRTCVGCRQRRPQGELVRCVLAAGGRPAVSRTAAGRGAWLCVPTGQCFDLAVRRRGFDRAWKRPASADALAELRELLDRGERWNEAGNARCDGGTRAHNGDRAERRAVRRSEAADGGGSEASPVEAMRKVE